MRVYRDRLADSWLYEQYVTVYKDENYMIWIDTSKWIINIFLEKKGLTLHFAYEDFESFRESINDLPMFDVDEEMADIYLEERELTLHFTYEDFHVFRDVLNNLEMLPKWWLCWN